MPDTTNRPTPEQIAEDCTVIAANLRSEGSFFAECRAERLEQLAELLAGGAIIVHPDDVPVKPRFNYSDRDYRAGDSIHAEGWNACRAHIFRDDQRVTP